jgi:hypothetical protein
MANNGAAAGGHAWRFDFITASGNVKFESYSQPTTSAGRLGERPIPRVAMDQDIDEQ